MLRLHRKRSHRHAAFLHSSQQALENGLFVGLCSGVKTVIHEVQFETINRNKNIAYEIYMYIVIIYTIGVVVYAYTTGEIPTLFLFPSILIIALSFFFIKSKVGNI